MRVSTHVGKYWQIESVSLAARVRPFVCRWISILICLSGAFCRMCVKFSIISINFHGKYRSVCFQFQQFSCGGCEDMYTSFNQMETIICFPLFRGICRSWNTCMFFIFCYVLIIILEYIYVQFLAIISRDIFADAGTMVKNSLWNGLFE